MNRLNNIDFYHEKERLNRVVNADKIKQVQKKSHIKCAKRIKEHNAKYYIENKETIDIRNAEWQHLNKDKIKKRNQEYFKENRPAFNARTAKRKAAKLQATLKNLSVDQLNEIKSFYTEAERLTKETGIIHHVDHIIPLQGKNVRGLHVPWNLQVITATENLKKGNRTDAKTYTEEVDKGV